MLEQLKHRTLVELKCHTSSTPGACTSSVMLEQLKRCMLAELKHCTSSTPGACTSSAVLEQLMNREAMNC